MIDIHASLLMWFIHEATHERGNMETLSHKNTPWEDEVDRYVGIVLMVQPIMIADPTQMHLAMLHAVYEEIPNVTYSTPWLKWATMQCNDELEEEQRVHYILLTAVKNKALGTIRIIGTKFVTTPDWQEKGDAVLVDPHHVWDKLGDKKGEIHPHQIIELTVPVETPKATKITKKRVVKQRKPQIRKKATV